jgi:hypothetical protein
VPIPGAEGGFPFVAWEYEFDIIHRPSVQHAVADYLSRLEFGEAPTGVVDDFPDAGVMMVTPKTEPKDDDLDK